MSELILRPDNTPQGQKAMALHFEIKSALERAASAIVDFCRQLKTMRDQKLYLHIGFDSFEDYVQKAHGINQRWAYEQIMTYEKLGPKFMEANADIGITKLSLLTKVSAIHRDEFVEENDVADITVAELKKLIEEKNGLSEQVSFFQSEVKDKEQLAREREELIAKIKRLNEELENKDQVMFAPVETASIDSELAEKIRAEEREKAEKLNRAEKERLRQAYDKEMKTAVDEAVKKEKEKSEAKLEKERAGFEKEKQAAADRAVKEAREKLVAEFEEDNKYILSQLNEQKEKAAALEKQLALNGNKDTVKFSILFSSVQETLAELEELIETISEKDRETGAKYNNALQRLFRSKIESEE